MYAECARRTRLQTRIIEGERSKDHHRENSSQRLASLRDCILTVRVTQRVFLY